MKKYLKMAMQKKPFIFLDQLIYRFTAHNVTGSGAEMTYFLILSIFPFIIMLLNALSYTSLARKEVILHMIRYIPTDIQKFIEGFVQDVTSGSSQELLSIAAIGGLWTASNGIKAVIRSLNKAYECTENRSFIKQRGISILFTLALIVMIIVVFVALIFGEVIGRFVFDLFNLGSFFKTIWSYLRFIIPLIFLILTFTLLYKFSPNIKKSRNITLKKAFPGAMLGSLAWLGLSTLFSFYVSNFGNYSVAYGSLGGVIIMLVWLYISSIVIILGGEINATLESLKERNFAQDPKKSFVKKIIDAKEELGKA